jgi:hypothetical protein
VKPSEIIVLSWGCGGIPPAGVIMVWDAVDVVDPLFNVAGSDFEAEVTMVVEIDCRERL